MINLKNIFTLFAIGAQIVCSQLWDDDNDEMSVVVSNRSAIVNGYDSPERNFYVRIKIRHNKGESWCGGSIITSEHVLSAAHCFKHGGSVTVEVGDFTQSRPRLQRIRARYRIHPGYVSTPNGVSKDDIALVYLTEAVSKSQKLKLCTQDYDEFTIAVCGMGSTSGTATYVPRVLQEVRLYESPHCPYNDWSFKIQICLMGVNRDVCRGDSGGPVYPLKSSAPLCLYGVVSFGSPKCTGWGVYTRVSAYIGWIKQNLV